jgi:oxygen-independent coproporphyrinogen III oxidase
MTTPSPIRALYVHVPFCRTLCGYCDFYSVVLEPDRAGPLVDAEIAELASARAVGPIVCDTIFVGGGTPTVLPPDQLARLLHACAGLAGKDGPIEFTVEANPATLGPEVARLLVTAGVNRVSIGAQSFDPAELRALERTHEPADVIDTVALCRRQGIAQISLDLIFAIPGQTLESWLASLTAAIDLGPDHISCYGLTYEEGTPLHRRLQDGLVERTDPDLEADLYEAAIDTLAAAGYAQYEISNFARPGAECRHNLVYWHNQPYLGIGPAAAGFVDGLRYKNVPDIAQYVHAIQAGQSAHAEEECLPPERRARETAMLALRLAEGLNRRSFADRFGDDPAIFFAAAIEKHARAGLLELTPTAIRLTRPGRPLADTVIADFL